MVTIACVGRIRAIHSSERSRWKCVGCGFLRSASRIQRSRFSSAGNAFNWRYTLALPVGGRVVEVQLDDWMYLMDGGRTVINRAVMHKFGVRVGELTLAFAKG